MIKCKYGGAECAYADGEWTSDQADVADLLNTMTPGALFDASPLGVPPDMEWAEANAVMEAVGGDVVSEARKSTSPPGTIH